MPDPVRVAAAIDVGSNTIKLTIASLDDGNVEPLAGSAEVVRLSEGLGQTGRIRPERIDRAINVLGGFVALARSHGAKRILAVATEAVRTASNGPEFLTRVKSEVGLDVRTITGQEEAALTSEGVLAQIDPAGSALILDIGGGSTEVIVTRDGAILGTVSLPVGSGIMTDTYISHDPPTPAELDTIEQVTSDRASAFLDGQAPFDRLILVGGVGQYLLSVLKCSGPVDADAITEARAIVLGATAAQLAPRASAPIARARVLPAGFAIARAMNRIAQAITIETVANGLRFGMLRRLALSDCSEEVAR